jgi:hypothetical protein
MAWSAGYVGSPCELGCRGLYVWVVSVVGVTTYWAQVSVMPNANVEELLRDARLVVDFAVRVGRLPDDTLLKAIHSTESAPPTGVAQELPALATALNKGVLAIAPMTLVDLRTGGNPFDTENQPSIKRLQALFSALTILLTIISALGTEYLHRQETALNALREIQSTRPLDKLNALRKMVALNAVLSKRDPINYDHYHQGISELRELQDKVSGSYQLLTSVAHPGWFEKWLGPRLTYAALSPTGTYSSNDYAELIERYAHKESHADTSTAEAGPPPAAPAPGAAPAAQGVSAKVATFPDCQLQDTVPESQNYPQWVNEIIADSADETCFAMKLGLTMTLPQTSLVYKVQGDMAALNGWLLPFLYGLLGASVYVMRNLLDPRTPTMGVSPAIVRIALGGIAGIIIGWFWIPSAFKAGNIAAITSVPFGLAFLAGFSIDILFSILDRVGKTVSEPASLQRAG